MPLLRGKTKHRYIQYIGFICINYISLRFGYF